MRRLVEELLFRELMFVSLFYWQTGGADDEGKPDSPDEESLNNSASAGANDPLSK